LSRRRGRVPSCFLPVEAFEVLLMNMCLCLDRNGSKEYLATEPGVGTEAGEVAWRLLWSHTESAASIISAPFHCPSASLDYGSSLCLPYIIPLSHLPHISVSLFPVHDHNTTQCPPSPHPCPAPPRSTVIHPRCSSCRPSHILFRWCVATPVSCAAFTDTRLYRIHPRLDAL
jgi:hypothetical protein